MYWQSRDRPTIRALTIAGALLGAALCGVGSAQAWTHKVIYSFCATTNCTDGAWPNGLLMDGDHNIYGTTVYGGDANDGVVFELAFDAASQTWTYSRLHSFCSDTGCPDGLRPQSTLIIDQAGNLYGTAEGGGLASDPVSTVFELSPNADRSKWKFKVLHRFCHIEDDSCRDGANPQTGLTYAGAASGAPYDGISALYGSTFAGGRHGGGTMFELTPVAGKWKERIDYDFCAQGGAACTDGRGALELLVDPSGRILGTTYGGGDTNAGTIFQLSYDDASGKWNEAVLYSFVTGTFAGLAEDASGTLFGTTLEGGADNQGTVFSFADGNVTTLHSFCLRHCKDGAYPRAGLTLSPTGDIFGTASAGGVFGGGFPEGNGTVFRMHGAKVHPLYQFCQIGDCFDGAGPQSRVLLDTDGKVLGTTAWRGAGNGGTVFELTP